MAWKDTAGRTIRPTCRGGVRHWFTRHGRVGVRTPFCVRCGARNPKPLTNEELDEWAGLPGSAGGPRLDDEGKAL